MAPHDFLAPGVRRTQAGKPPTHFADLSPEAAAAVEKLGLPVPAPNAGQPVLRPVQHADVAG